MIIARAEIRDQEHLICFISERKALNLENVRDLITSDIREAIDTVHDADKWTEISIQFSHEQED